MMDATSDIIKSNVGVGVNGVGINILLELVILMQIIKYAEVARIVELHQAYSPSKTCTKT